MITIHTLTYNEEVILPHFIKHYKKNFPNCVIKIYDNESTDNTIEIAKTNNCEIIPYYTNNELNDDKYLEIKNNVWKESKTDWNIVCDVDEFCIINEENLLEENKKGTTIIKFTAYDMINMSSDPNNSEIENIYHGVRHNIYDKDLIFNKKHISDINYHHGCHNNSVKGNVKYSSNQYKMLHFKYIGENFIVKRYENFRNRMSQQNKQRGWGIQYLMNEQQIRNLYKEQQNKSIKIDF